MRNIITAVVFAAMSSAAMAQDVTTAPAALTETTETIADPAVNSIFASVCNGSFVLSDKATAACATQTMPKATKRGDRFTATALGAEFMTLYRQMTPPTAG